MLFTHSSIFGVITILLQMIGFVLMIKYYDKKPTYQDAKKLLEKEITKHPEGLKYDVTIDLATPAGGRQETMDVSKGVAWDLGIRKKSGLFLILFGLFLQIMPFVS